ncbi:IS66 family insertion sequence element accessory protein TnpB [Azospirillum griseum]|uniref:IS66 family insertion sequence element accessory protein TnpB n=1 Tax=Azospirillum griseum TaxID=2496639 RepID=UPI00362A0F92
MIPVPSGVRVWLARGHTDMRKGGASLALLMQERFAQDPHSGHLFLFRGRCGGLVKIIWLTVRAVADRRACAGGRAAAWGRHAGARAGQGQGRHWAAVGVCAR